MKMQSLTRALSDADRQLFVNRLGLLLKEQTERYTGFESTSLPTDTARSLLESLLFTLEHAAEDQTDLLLCETPEVLFDSGQKRITERVSALKELWQQICIGSHKLHNGYYEDTLRNIGLFFRRYDIRFAAHELSCSIDYPLLIPVPETLRGVDYIGEYLRRIYWENGFLLSLDSRRLQWFLRSSLPAYETDYLNLCEAPFTNTVGLRLLGSEQRSLSVSEAQCTALQALLSGKSDAETEALLRSAGAAAAPKGGEGYFSAAAAALLPRLRTALEHENLSNIFIR